MKLLGVKRLPRTDEYVVAVEHGMWIFKWTHEYQSGASEILGCWEWRRLPEVSVVTSLDLLDQLDLYLQDFIIEQEKIEGFLREMNGKA